MDEQRIFSCLCSYDPRNPNSGWADGWMEEGVDPVAPVDGCSCDNCFYGRNEMALEIIRLRESLTRITDAYTDPFVSDGEIARRMHQIAQDALDGGE